MKYINKFNNIALNLLVLITMIFLLISIYSFFQTSIMNKPYSNILGYTLFEVKTGSMAESIKIGDVVLVKIQDLSGKNSLKVNDIISFYDKDNIITHRIKEIDTKIVTKGDNNNASDNPIAKEDVIGKVEKIIPKLGIYKKVLLDKKVFLLICLSVSLFFISFSIKESDEKGEKEDEIAKDK